jgi:hypothetical protein
MGKLFRRDFQEIAAIIGKQADEVAALKVAFALIPFLRSCNPAFDSGAFKAAILAERERHKEIEERYRKTMLEKYP